MNKQRFFMQVMILIVTLFLLSAWSVFSETHSPSKSGSADTSTKTSKKEPVKQENTKESNNKQAENKKDKAVVLKADPALMQLLKSSPTQKEFPHSGAVILADNSVIGFNEDGSSVNKEHRIIKILTQQGLQRYGELRLPFSTATQKINLEELRVVRSDGRLIPVPKEAIQELSPPTSGGAQAFSHLRVLIIQFPGLDINGLVEYKISIEDKSGLRSLLGYEIYVQETEPILESKIIVSAPKGKIVHYQGINLGKSTPEITDEGNKRNYVWAYKSMAPFFMEQSMPAAKDFVGRLVIGLGDSWDTAASEIGKIFLSKIPGDKDLETAMKNIVKDAKNVDEKFSKIYGFVAGDVKTLPIELGRVGFTPQDASTILKDKMGDAKDKTALLIGMLKNIGIEARPVLVSTNGNGRIVKDIVAAVQFNHVLVWIPSKQLWLDPSSEAAQIGYLPPDSQGVDGIVLGEKGGAFITTPVSNAVSNREEISSSAKLLPDATLETELALVEHGANNLFLRYFLRGVKPQERIMALEALANQITPRFQITSSYFSPMDDFNSPLEMKVAFQGKNYAMPAGDLLIFPIPTVTTSRLEDQLRVVSAERKYPFVLGSAIHEDKIVNLLLPQGYRLRVVPKGDEVTNNIGTYKANFTLNDGKLLFKSSFIVNKSSVPVEEFGNLKRLVEARSQMEREKLVLEKIK